MGGAQLQKKTLSAIFVDFYLRLLLHAFIVVVVRRRLASSGALLTPMLRNYFFEGCRG
jgi:hypothetical protein